MIEIVQDPYQGKVVTAAEAISHLKNGSRVFIGSGCGEPQHLIRTMVNDIRVQDIMIIQMLTLSFADYVKTESFFKRFSLKLFFVSNEMRDAAYAGKVDYIPSYLSEIPSLFKSNQIGLDIALIQVSPPDKFGYASLGVSVDVAREAVRSAQLVIAQVNRSMPVTHGDGYIHIDEIDYLVPYDEPLPEIIQRETETEVIERIAMYVSELIDDGSTIEIGGGLLPYFILKYLDKKNDLGVHTQMISDEFIPLFKKGVVTNRKKNFFKDRAVTSFCMGTRKVYDYVDNNPSFFFGPTDLVNNPNVISRNDNFISISTAVEVDLTGQVCCDAVGRSFFTGTGDQANFIRGAALSKGGLSIIALPSTANNGTVSQIVGGLSEGAGIATLRADVNFVVTEYGIAQLKGKSLYQRAIELTQIAHPDFRGHLINSAKSYHYIFPDQLPPPAEDLIFLEAYKSRIVLKNGKTLFVRPLMPADEIAYRNFFYSLKKETVYLRFFRDIKVFSHEMAQDHWAQLDYRQNITLVGQVRDKGNWEIMAIGTYFGDEDGRAEVAFVVREDFQGMGVATYLLKQLKGIAITNGYKGFVATVLAENKAMQQVFLKVIPKAIMKKIGKELRMQMDF